MTQTITPKCFECLYYIGIDAVFKIEVCRAFPRGIPDEILHGNKSHETPVAGDRGLQFKHK
jgi:hypothetical protein